MLQTKISGKFFKYHFYLHMCDIIFDQSARSIFARCKALNYGFSSTCGFYIIKRKLHGRVHWRYDISLLMLKNISTLEEEFRIPGSLFCPLPGGGKKRDPGNEAAFNIGLNLGNNYKAGLKQGIDLRVRS